MRPDLRRAGVTAAAVALGTGLAACGDGGANGTAGDEGGLTIGLLLPENQSARYETFDKPLIEERVKELCGACTLEYANAQGDVATQQLQVDAMIGKGADVLLLTTVDEKSLRSTVEDAVGEGIPVIAYDRDVEGPISAYVSFNGLAITRLQSEALLEALGDKTDGGEIVRIEGPEINPAAIPLPVLEGKVKVSKMYQGAAWSAQSAYALMAGAIATLGPGSIDGVLAANDALAGGVISALKDARIDPLPPVVGQDAELAAVQRIVQGEQYMTVYKPFEREADIAAEMAVALGRGEGLAGIAEEDAAGSPRPEVPSVVLEPVSVTVGNIEETIIADGMYTIDQICTPEYRSACEGAGLT